VIDIKFLILYLTWLYLLAVLLGKNAEFFCSL